MILSPERKKIKSILIATYIAVTATIGAFNWSVATELKADTDSYNPLDWYDSRIEKNEKKGLLMLYHAALIATLCGFPATKRALADVLSGKENTPSSYY